MVIVITKAGDTLTRQRVCISVSLLAQCLLTSCRANCWSGNAGREEEKEAEGEDGAV